MGVQINDEKTLFCFVGNKKFGPFSRSQINQLLESGAICRETVLESMSGVTFHVYEAHWIDTQDSEQDEYNKKKPSFFARIKSGIAENVSFCIPRTPVGIFVGVIVVCLCISTAYQMCKAYIKPKEPTISAPLNRERNEIQEAWEFAKWSVKRRLAYPESATFDSDAISSGAVTQVDENTVTVLSYVEAKSVTGERVISGFSMIITNEYGDLSVSGDHIGFSNGNILNKGN